MSVKIGFKMYVEYGSGDRNWPKNKHSTEMAVRMGTLYGR